MDNLSQNPPPSFITNRSAMTMTRAAIDEEKECGSTNSNGRSCNQLGDDHFALDLSELLRGDTRPCRRSRSRNTGISLARALLSITRPRRPKSLQQQRNAKNARESHNRYYVIRPPVSLTHSPPLPACPAGACDDGRQSRSLSINWRARGRLNGHGNCNLHFYLKRRALIRRLVSVSLRPHTQLVAL